MGYEYISLFMENPTKKRPVTETTPDSDDDSRSVTSFPRFVVIKSNNPEKPVAGLSPFVVEKTVKGILGMTPKIKKLRSGELLLEVEQKKYSDQILHLKTIFQLRVTAYPHTSLNSCKGVI